MKKKPMSLSFLGRFLASLSVGIAIVGLGFVAYFTILSPLIASSPWSIQLLVIETMILPLVTFSMYLMYRVLLVRLVEKKSNDRLQQWMAVFLLIYVYSLGLVFFSFLLERLTPFLPQFYKEIFLPMVINLILIVALTKTRIWPHLDRFIKRLSGESSVS